MQSFIAAQVPVNPEAGGSAMAVRIHPIASTLAAAYIRPVSLSDYGDKLPMK